MKGDNDSVRASRDGDQFHYQWAARKCLLLLSPNTDLVAVTIEGPSKNESNAPQDAIAGTSTIDVGLYYGSEDLARASRVRYVQLKHSSSNSDAITGSFLRSTLDGFAKRYSALVQRGMLSGSEPRLSFDLVVNRPIATSVSDALASLRSGTTPPEQSTESLLLSYVHMSPDQAQEFFRRFDVTGDEPSLWEQRNLLARDSSMYVVGDGETAMARLADLVAQKATTKFADNPTICRTDVLTALRTSDRALFPAPNHILAPEQYIPRQHDEELLIAIQEGTGPIVVHADGGVGKSATIAKLATSIPDHSLALIYDCFGNGLYRTPLGSRHRHSEALVHICNTLAAHGLCYPLIASGYNCSTKEYLSAFVDRIEQAAAAMTAADPAALIYLIVDAADNAQMAADEAEDSACFAVDLVQTKLPDAVRLVLTCRSHRRDLLRAPRGTKEFHLQSFNRDETAAHLRTRYPAATDRQAREFGRLTSNNPRLQSRALSARVPLEELLLRLGPDPVSVDAAIDKLLRDAVTALSDRSGRVESGQIRRLCEGLAVLRPLVPIGVLAGLADVSESAVRSFCSEIGRPLLVKGDAVHFTDEPAETWFRDNFHPAGASLDAVIAALREHELSSPYVASVIPRLLLRAGRLDELVQLGLEGTGLPTSNPIERRDVELQRLVFALKACINSKRYLDASRLALKAGGECAGDERQSKLIRANTHIAGYLVSTSRAEELASRGRLAGAWTGSNYVHEASLLAAKHELHDEARVLLRQAHKWIDASLRNRSPYDYDKTATVDNIAEAAFACLRLHGAEEAAAYMRCWRSSETRIIMGRSVARRLVDIGDHQSIHDLALACAADMSLYLGIAIETNEVLASLPAESLDRAVKRLERRRPIRSSGGERDDDWLVLSGVRAIVEMCLRSASSHPHAKLGRLLLRRLPPAPPSSLTFGFGRGRTELLRSYTLEAALNNRVLALKDIAPAHIVDEIDASQPNTGAPSRDAYEFTRGIGPALPAFAACAAQKCGRASANHAEIMEDAYRAALESEAHRYQSPELGQAILIDWARSIAASPTASAQEAFKAAIEKRVPTLWPIEVVRVVSRSPLLVQLAASISHTTYSSVYSSSENASMRSDALMDLARGIFVVSRAEAVEYFERAVEVAGTIGDENMARWAAFLRLGEAAADGRARHPRTAYRLARAAELSYQYIVDDKHFEWLATTRTLSSLCGPSALAILSRWRDRDFGRPRHLLPEAVEYLRGSGQISATLAACLPGLALYRDRVLELRAALSTENDATRRRTIVETSYRYMRMSPPSDPNEWREIIRLALDNDASVPDAARLLALATKKSVRHERVKPTDTDSASVPDITSPPIGMLVDVDDALRAFHVRRGSAARGTRHVDILTGMLRDCDPGKESLVLDVCRQLADFGVFDLRQVIDTVSRPFPKQLSFIASIKSLVLTVVERDPHHVYRHGWPTLPFDRLHEEGVVTPQELANAQLSGFGRSVETLRSDVLFGLCEPLAICMGAGDSLKALHFGLDLIEQRMAPDCADGDWRPELVPKSDTEDSLAGYVWAGLSSPAAQERWRSAHVVRTAVELGQVAFVRSLIAYDTDGIGGAFVDSTLPHYLWHGRLWLAIGLAGGAVQNPSALTTIADWLHVYRRCPHVLLRALAESCLVSMANAGCIQRDNSEPQGDPNAYTARVGERPRDAGDRHRSKALSPSASSTSFGWNIDPYWLEPLANAFDVSTADVVKLANAAVNEFVSTTPPLSARDIDVRYTKKVYKEGSTYHSHYQLPAADDFKSYLVFHGMMIAASRLLDNGVPRRESGEERDGFKRWMSYFAIDPYQKRWRADRRDPRILNSFAEGSSWNDEHWRFSILAHDFESACITDDDMSVVWASWVTGDYKSREVTNVRSALVPASRAEAILASLQTGVTPYSRALPAADLEGVDTDTKVPDGWEIHGWVCHEDESAGLDEHDPWSAGLPCPGPVPSEDIQRKLGTVASDDGRTWLAPSGGLLRSEVWSTRDGHGINEEYLPGTRLSCNRQFFADLATVFPDSRLLISVEINRTVDRERPQKDDIPHPLSYCRYYLVGGDGAYRPLKSSH